MTLRIEKTRNETQWSDWKLHNILVDKVDIWYDSSDPNRPEDFPFRLF